MAIILFLSALFSRPLAESKLLPPNHIHRLSAINDGETIHVKSKDIILIKFQVQEGIYIFEGYCYHAEHGPTCKSYKILKCYGTVEGKIMIIKNSPHLRKIRVDNKGVTWSVLVEQSEPQRFLFNK